MAQQGGTYHLEPPRSYHVRKGIKTFGSPPASNKVTPTTDVPKPDNENKLSDEWHVVEWPIVDDRENADTSDGRIISSQFKLDLGWGSWRTTVFGWDVNVRNTTS